jgi:hypothetical protein
MRFRQTNVPADPVAPAFSVRVPVDFSKLRLLLSRSHFIAEAATYTLFGNSSVLTDQHVVEIRGPSRIFASRISGRNLITGSLHCHFQQT